MQCRGIKEELNQTGFEGDEARFRVAFATQYFSTCTGSPTDPESGNETTKTSLGMEMVPTRLVGMRLR